MDTQDLKSVLSGSEVSSPEEAAQNINRSSLLDISPDSYKDLKSELEPKVIANERIPSSVEPKTQEYLKQSKEHFGLGQEDVPKMSDTEKMVNHYNNKFFVLPEKERELNDLSRKKMMSPNGVLDAGDEEQLQDLDSTIGELHKSAASYDSGMVEGFVGDVVGVVKDIAASYWHNKELIAGAVGTGAVVGGAYGSVVSGAGTIAGAITGGGVGLAQSLVAVPFLDAYKQTSGSIYHDLGKSVDENGQPLNLSHDRKKIVAQAVGAVSGTVAAYAGKVFTSNNPYLRKFADPKAAAKYIAGNPSLLAKMDILGGLLKSGAAEGFEEGSQQFVEILGTEFGKIDSSEESFKNALNTSIDRIKSEVPYATVLGAAAGGTISSATSLPAYNKVKAEYTKAQEVSTQKQRVLETQNMLIEATHMMSETKIQKLAPDEAKSFKKKLLEGLGIDTNMWATVEDLRKFANSPEKGKKIRNYIDLNPELVKLAQDTNSTIPLGKAEVLDIMTEFPDLSEHLRTHPDGQSPLEIRDEAKVFTENMSKADARRAEVMKTIGLVSDVGANQAALKEALTPLKDSAYFKDQTDYLENNIITERDGIVSKEQADTLNNTYMDAKLSVANELKASTDAEYNTLENKAFRETNKIIVEQEIKQMSDDLNLLDRFTGKIDNKNRNANLTANHQEVGKFSPYAIDPRYLPDELREYYVNDPVLQKRKVFTAGGLDPEEAAAFMGVESGEELLKKLANIPDRKTLKNLRKQREIGLKNQIQQGFKDERIAARDAVFDKMTSVHLKEMNYLKDNEWTTVKRGVIKIAGKVPSVKSLDSLAETQISKLRIRDLNANRFKQGQEASKKMAVKQFMNGEIEQSFANTEKAAYNSSLMKNTLKAQDKVGRFERFWKKMSSETNIQELKDAKMYDVMQEWMSLYKMEGTVRNESEKTKFADFVKKQASLGNVIPPIPDRLNDTQQSYKDLTVEQYQAMTEMGQFILQQAKLKNEILAKRKAKAEFITQETIAAEVDRLTKEHVDYDPTRAKKDETVSKDAEFILNVHNKVKTLMSAYNGSKNIILGLDNDITGGFFYRTFMDPMVQAQTSKRQDNFDMADYTRDVIKEFYGTKKNYDTMLGERVVIPEFKNIPSLNYGNLRKVDLLRMMAFVGDPDGRKNIKNYVDTNNAPLSFDTVMAVLEREVSEKEAGFVHNMFVSPFKRFEKSAFDLHKRTTGIDAEKIIGVPFTHRGKVYEGGFQPLEYQRLPDEVRAANEEEKLANQKLFDEGGFFAPLRSAEMTNQDRLKERVGSQRPMRLDFENHFKALEEIIHDIHFREVGIDLMKILKKPDNVINLKSVIGSQNFGVLIDSIKDVVSKTSDKDADPLHREQNAAIKGLLGFGKQLHAIKAIGFNFISAGVQWQSLVYLPLRSGVKTFIYMGKTSARLVANPLLWSKMESVANDILPDSKYEQDTIDDTLIKSMDEFIGSGNVFFKNYNGLGKGLSRLLKTRKKVIDASFYLLRQADKFNKIIAVNSLAEQFLNGDIEGWSKEKIDKMSASEKKVTMQRVVKQLIDVTLTANSTLDKTALEKNKNARLLVNYITDRRSRFITLAAQLNKSRKNIKRGEYTQAANQLILMGLISGAGAALENTLRGKDDESMLDKAKKVNTVSDASDFAQETLFDFATTPFVQMGQSIPGVDSVLYAIESATHSRNNQVRPASIPIMNVLTDVAMGVISTQKLLDDGLRTVNKYDRKALINLAGFAVGGAPTNQINKVIDAVSDSKLQRNAKEFLDDITHLNDTIKEYSDKFKDVPEAQPIIEDLKEYQKTLPQMPSNNEDHIIPENTKETLKQALSEGRWTKFDPDTGAVGIYQYTEDAWKERMVLSPDLGLTENGRLAKDPAQQERAMERELQDNTKSFMAYDIPVTEANLFGAHKFGFDNFATIYESKDSEKLSTIIGDSAKSPEFKNFTTVGDVKKFILRQVKTAK